MTREGVIGLAGFSDIAGHDRLKEYFRRCSRSGNTPHALILSGEDGMGKMMLARAYAMSLLCENGNGCGTCRSCKQFLTDNHPDVIYVGHEKPASIGVDDVRDQLVSSAQYPPYQGDRKIYIVDEAEKMTPQAQNALLKTIEEPPSYMMIMLLASHEESLLQTILSRCITLQLKPVPDSIIIQFLIDKFGADERTAGAAAALARGNPGRAIALFQSEEFTNMHAKTIELLKSIPDKPLYQLLSDLTDLKGEIDEVFETMKLWYRDVVIFKATRDSNLLIFKDEKKAVMAAADRISFNGLDEIQGAIEKAQVRLRSNVSFELTAMLLLTTLQEQSVMRK